MRHWELDKNVYTGEIITEMKMLLRVLSKKSYENSPEYVKSDGIKYEDYCKLVSGKDDYDSTTIEELNYWICDYITKLRQWLGKKEPYEEILDIVLRNR